MTDQPTRPRRAILRQWLARPAELRRHLDALAPDGLHGAVLAERLRFGPPETWHGWRAGFGAVAVKLWPAAAPPPPLRPVIHPGVAPLLDQGGNWRMFAWIEGRTLAAALRQGPMDAQVVDQVADALAALHAAGQTHGDLTPANVVLSTGGAVLIDWGERSTGTPGWRPEHAHDPMERDRFALARLHALIAAPPAGNTPAAAPRCQPGRE